MRYFRLRCLVFQKTERLDIQNLTGLEDKSKRSLSQFTHVSCP